MEYLEGETLAERLQRGALPLPQARRHATEIADALDRAGWFEELKRLGPARAR